jgi:carbamoyltransferase
MIICGLKLTHDSSIAIIENNRLVQCIELEKIDNNTRFKIIENLNTLPKLVAGAGYAFHQFDAIAIDGWVGLDASKVNTRNDHGPVSLPVATYHEQSLDNDILGKYMFSGLEIEGVQYTYESYTHVAGHILSAYATSPFSKQNEDAYILIWDGGMYPRLYFLDWQQKKIINYGALFYFGVNMYSIFAQHFGPFKINENVIKDELSIAGKVMAYAALGKSRPDIIEKLQIAYESSLPLAKDHANISNYPYQFARVFKDLIANEPYFDEDIITSFHIFIQQLLTQSLAEKVMQLPHSAQNLCLGGGAALNIKWNSAIRNAGIFEGVWVSPFPNDSGSAIGAAIAANFHHTGSLSIDWTVYSGCELVANAPMEGWHSRDCSIAQLAELLHTTQEPVIFFQKNAELGPRALGSRSILATAQLKKMKDVLNYVKYREPYRPVAPICIEEHAPSIFSPGSPDPFMLFDHAVKEGWAEKIPAVCHLDGTARLQTVGKTDNPQLYQLLQAYYQLSGVPVLCNTSANLKGSGFFPDIFSATRWNKVNYVWYNNTLFEKTTKLIFE